MTIKERVNSILDTIKNIWKIAKPIICALETVEEKRVVLKILMLYRDNKLYTKGNKRYTEIDVQFSVEEHHLLDKIIAKLDENESSN